jgi:hypothetical protein
MPRRRTVASLLVAVIIAGCGGSAAPSASSATATTQTVGPSVALASRPPTPAPPSPEPSLGNGVPSGDIPAGTYTATGFAPNVTFTIGEGWTQTIDPESAPEDAILLVFTPEPGDEAIYIDSKAPTIPPAQSLQGTFGRLKGVTLGEPFDVALGGASGLAVDGQISPDFPEPEQKIFGLSEDYFMRPGDRFRAYALELDGDPFYIIVESTDDGFETFLDIAGPVLESMTFG